MQVIEITKTVPLPDKRYRYPYDKMEVNDSFVVPVSHRQNVFNANWRAAKRLGWKFMARREGEYIRVWRVA